MKWSVERKALAGLGFASVILIVINVVAYWNLTQHKRTANEFIQASEVLEYLETVSSSVKDAETEQQGYIITGQQTYLKPYLDAVANINLELLKLRQLATIHPTQRQRLSRLESLVAQKLLALEQTSDLRRTKGLEAARRVVSSAQGRQAMAELRRVIQEMEQEERNRLQQSVQEARINAKRDALISTTGIVFSFISLYFVYYSIKREMAAHRQTELALQKLNTETCEALLREQELNNLKSRIITVVSHEYRTPLTTILSSAEILDHYGHKLSEDKKLSHLQRIQSAARHLTDLVTDVLDISQADTGSVEFKPSPMDLELFCRQVVEEIQKSTAQNHPITFVALGNSCPYLADEKLLRQILTNLLSNAIKYSPCNSTVHFFLQCQENAAVFRIRDRGIGIPTDDRPQLFKPFERGSNVGTTSGTGLGLAITKTLVDLHGGQIAVESEIGVGTTFTVTLPLHRALPALRPA
ncbi:MAG TPA: CHASE3 domain-containing protein [Allocoleopsis sp.]